MAGNSNSDYLEKLRLLATTKRAGWDKSDCPVLRTTTMQTENAWKKALRVSKLSEEDLFKKCELAIQAQAIFRRDQRSANAHVAQPVMLSRWLNEGRWEEEIGSHAEVKEKAKGKKCNHCDNETYGPKFTECEHHLFFTPEGKYKGWKGDVTRQWYKEHPEERNRPIPKKIFGTSQE